MFRDLPALLYIGAVDELKRIDERDGVLSIGAAASLEDAWRALVARWPTLAEVWLRFAGVPLRHTGTMGGNVANGSPIGDSAPVLMALDATLVLRRGERDAARSARRFLHRLHEEPARRPASSCRRSRCRSSTRAAVRAYKISKRFDCDISAVCAGLAIELDDAGTVVAARLAFGGMAATVQRAARAEAALVGKAWDEAAVAAAQAALASDFAPLTDMRASAAYRMQVAQNLLQRFWLETRANAPLAASESSVWSAMAHVVPQRASRRRREPIARPTMAESARRARRRGGAERRRHRRRRLAARTSRRTCTSPAARPTSTTCPSSPARCTPRSACRRSRTAASSRSIATASRRCPASSPSSSPPTSPVRTIAARSIHDDPILADGVVHYLGQPVFAVIAETRDAARRAAAQAKAALTIEPLAPILTPVEAHAAQSYVLPPMHLARGDARAAIAAAPHRLADTLEVGGQEQFYLEGQISYAVPREDRGMLVHCSTQHPSEMQHLVAQVPRPAVAPRAGRVPAHGRRLRRQGIAVGAVRLRRRDRGANSSAGRSSCASTATTTS